MSQFLVLLNENSQNNEIFFIIAHLFVTVRHPFVILITGSLERPTEADDVDYLCQVPGGSLYGSPIWMGPDGQRIETLQNGKYWRLGSRVAFVYLVVVIFNYTSSFQFKSCMSLKVTR